MIDIRKFINSVLQELFKTTYAHVLRPSIQVAKVVAVKKITETEYSYTLKLLDINLEKDQEIPEIPGVLSEKQYQKNEEVVISLLYGNTSNLYIIGRYYR